MVHHPVFSKFTLFAGEQPAYTTRDCVGSIVHQQFVAGLGCRPFAIDLPPQHPAIDEEYFEWIDLLESVVAARGSYTMVELGAGFGRWSVRAGLAMKRFNPDMPCRLVAVEGEPMKFEWMRRHFTLNGINPAHHTLIHGAISAEAGDVLFYIGGPRGGPFDCSPDAWFGQALTKDYEMLGKSKEDGEYCGRKVLQHESGWRSIRVPGVSLAGILRDLGRVDLIDMDMEGEELPATRSAIVELDAKVRRLHIATHSEEVEFELRDLLPAHGWRSTADYSLGSTHETPWGPIAFQDGVQSWVNPRI